MMAKNNKNLCLIFGDQLSHSISSLENISKTNDVVVMFEVLEENTHVKHHKQKIAFVLSAMRHFSEALKENGIPVYYVKIDDENNTQSLDGELNRAIQHFKSTKIILTEPSEFRVKEKINRWVADGRVTFEIRDDTRFLCSHSEFQNWAKNKNQLRMEFFYREMRKKYNILLDDSGKPLGGKWNFDKENRNPIKKNIAFLKKPYFEKDDITQEILNLVEKMFPDHFGSLNNFHWATTREQALALLNHFIDYNLNNFGDFQDAMLADEAFIFHSVLSPYINFGLLNPLEICKQVEYAYREGRVKLNSAEGFIRQILGWREYVRGIYWLNMPSYENKNYLSAKNKLPDFYWNANTDMNCLHQAIHQTHEFAYSHHIQRLMITGNFALLCGIDPKMVCEWYLIVYADALDWVELPNTLGMSLYGDGGLMASKPYAASGKYIARMSNFCDGCKYDPTLTVGEQACPFNFLYWDFAGRHEDKLKPNQRLAYTYANWKKMDPDIKKAIRKQAKAFLETLFGLT
ncbi:MAG TPA: cryptochrome/photolyase family protein [Gammaproteobacteria bacterium]|nr:cryptochrome/photolyase family protein [Gammaproteobacteria bacterium]